MSFGLETFDVNGRKIIDGTPMLALVHYAAVSGYVAPGWAIYVPDYDSTNGFIYFRSELSGVINDTYITIPYTWDNTTKNLSSSAAVALGETKHFWFFKT